MFNSMPFMPWSYRYECFEISDLQKLPIDKLLPKEGLLCLWLTNSRNVHDSARRVIEKEWGLVPVAMWHWLKVCYAGRLYGPISTFSSFLSDLPDA